MEKVLEIISKYIEQLEEELEWYQEKNREWQEKCEGLQNKLDTFEANMKLAKRLNFSKSNQLQELRQENYNLREQLRWHSVEEKPPLETANCSKTVLLDVDYIGVFKMYYNYLSELWVGIQGKQEYFRQQDFKNTNVRWCYIPDDNQGTDCTQEGE